MAKQERMFEDVAPDPNMLCNRIQTQLEGVRSFNPDVVTIPEYITSNLKFDFFEWQKEAFEHHLFYNHPKNAGTLRKEPIHLMFNMATGTGKTLLMAAMILYYYKQGRRHFLFFVNQNNIVDKTENNIVNPRHNKYLFQENIVIDNKTVNIKKVDAFSDNPQTIEIKFTTIQKLYNDIHIERENQTTLDDLLNKDLVMLADEAHHLNAGVINETIPKSVLKFEKDGGFKKELKDSSGKKDVEKLGWNHTVRELLLNKNGTRKNNKNVLLEFTATIPDSKEVNDFYKDKIVFQYTLKKFLQSGYTKQINIVSSSLDKRDRILQSLMFSWYRHRIALKHGLSNFKPVILFRSKTIEESKADFEYFNQLVQEVDASDFEGMKALAARLDTGQQEIGKQEGQKDFEMGKPRALQMLKYINENDIRFSEIANYIKTHYKPQNIIITNSKTKKSQTEKTDAETETLLNSLEDKDNHIRAIFTVQRLTEGWDVLNLYDIVRLYEGRDEGYDKKGRRKAGTATVAERQLIGRGVRYYPFPHKDIIPNKRKFDEDLNADMRILEELFFYCTNEPRYLDEIRRELRKEGFIDDKKIVREFNLKSGIQDGIDYEAFYSSEDLWINERKKNPERRKKNLDDLKNKIIGEYRVSNLSYSELTVINKGLDFDIEEDKTKVRQLSIEKIPPHIFQKAIAVKAKESGSLLRFNRLKQELEIESVADLQETIFKDFEVRVRFPVKFGSPDKLPNKQLLDISIYALEQILIDWSSEIHPYVGSDFHSVDFKDVFCEAKTKSVKEKELVVEIPLKDWYLLDTFKGTGLEKQFIDFLANQMDELKKKYDEVYLLRNEEVYKIFDFKTGRGFCPDFLLFLKDKETKKKYHVYIEPKGGDHILLDKWKEDFLFEIKSRYGDKDILKTENGQYRLIGLPFYREDSDEQSPIDGKERQYDKFEREFNRLY